MPPASVTLVEGETTATETGVDDTATDAATATAAATDGATAADATSTTGIPAETGAVTTTAAREPQPRHRAERVRNRRAASAKGGVLKRSAALGSAVAFVGLSAFGALLPVEAEPSTAAARDSAHSGGSESGGATTATADGAAAGDSITEVVVADAGPRITSGLSTASAPFTGGTEVTLTGRSLDEAASVTVGSTPATIVSADETKLTFRVPAVAETAKGAAVEVTVTDAEGAPIEAVTTEAPISQTASLISAVAPADRAAEAAAEEPLDLTFTYTNDPGIDAQVQYVLAYWSSYNSAQYPVLSGVDCANFASQSLVARGWAMDAGWFYDASNGTMSPSWSSSTALRDYLLASPDRATALDDSQRAQVKVGDIAQFDWDSSGDRDHTAVVTRVEHTDAGTKVWVGGHTKDIDYWDVDTALATGGGSVTYFSIH